MKRYNSCLYMVLLYLTYEENTSKEKQFSIKANILFVEVKFIRLQKYIHCNISINLVTLSPE